MIFSAPDVDQLKRDARYEKALTRAKLGAQECVCSHESSRHSSAYPGVPKAEAEQRRAAGERWCSSCVCTHFRWVQFFK